MTVALPSFMESLLSPLVRPLSSVYVRLLKIANWRLIFGFFCLVFLGVTLVGCGPVSDFP